MRPLTREQLSNPKRHADPVSIPEYNAPLLVAKPSADLVVRLREGNINFSSAEGIRAMLSDMLVDDVGERMLSEESVPAFLKGIAADSLTALLNKCFEMQARKGGAPVPPEPSTSA